MIYINPNMIGYEVEKRILRERIFTDYQHVLTIDSSDPKIFALRLSSAFEDVDDSKLVGHVEDVYTGFGFKSEGNLLKRNNDIYCVNVSKKNSSKLIEVSKSK